MNHIKDKILHLTNILNTASNQYYNFHNSIMSDYEFDMKLKELEELEERYPEFKLENSPTVIVGSSSIVSKIKHNSKMLSLDNCYDLESVERWVKNLISSDSILIEHKFDGVSINLQYINGKLLKAITRGDGIEGEDVTNVINIMNTIPKNIETDIEFLEIRGEILISKNDFNKINLKLESENKKTYSNPRNLASGSLRLLDIDEARNRCLIFKGYEVKPSTIFKNNIDVYRFFEENNIDYNHGLLVELDSLTMNVIEDYVKKISLEKDNYDYEIDGLVFKNNLIYLREDENVYGASSKYPRWAKAFKFKDTVYKTKCLDVEFTVGRTGALTPVAILEPVLINNIKVKKATLHNMDEIKRLGLKIGDTVNIIRSAEVIPKILSVDVHNNGNEIIEPTFCPVCGSSIMKYDGAVDIYCTNNTCRSQIIFKLNYFCNRDNMNINGLSIGILEKLLDNGYLNEGIISIYKLHNFYNKLIDMEGLGKKSIDKLLLEIDNSKNNDLKRFISSLGIPLIGKSTSEKIILELLDIVQKTSIDLKTILMDFDISKLNNEDYLQYEYRKSFYSYIINDINIKYLKQFLELGINPIFKMNNLDSTILDSKLFCVSGKTSIPRSELMELISKNGGKFTNHINKHVTLICNDTSTSNSKVIDAKNNNSKIISESEFLNLLKE